ncbi:unnamed protein product, partial [Rotaria sp. Silwood2]
IENKNNMNDDEDTTDCVQVTLTRLSKKTMMINSKP